LRDPRTLDKTLFIILMEELTLVDKTVVFSHICKTKQKKTLQIFSLEAN